MVDSWSGPPGVSGRRTSIASLVWWTGLAVGIPAAHSSSTLDPALTPRFLALAVLAALTVALGAPWRACEVVGTLARRTRAGIVWAYVVYLIASATSLTVAVDVAEGVFDLARSALTGGVFVISAVLLRRDDQALPRLAKLVAASALAHATIGICQYHGLAFTHLPGPRSICSTLANKNLYSSWLLLCLPFLMYGVLELSRGWSAICTIAVQFAMHAIVLAQARSVWLAVLVACASTWLAFWRAEPISATGAHHPASGRRRAGACVVLAVLVVAVTLWLSPATFREMVLRPGAPVSSVTERLTLWTKTCQMAVDHPLLGVGAGNWKIQVPSYGTEGLRSETGDTHFQRPHNDLLWVWAQTGPVGGLAYLALFAFTIGAATAAFRDVSRTANARVQAGCALFGLVAYVVDAQFSFPRERIEHSVYLMLLAATAFSLPGRGPDDHQGWPGGVVKVVMALVPVGVFACIALGCVRANAEFHTRQALVARDRGDWETVVHQVDAGASPLATMDPAATPLAWYRGVANYMLGRFALAHQDFAEAYRHHPYHLHVLNNLGTCYEIAGDHNRALDLYRQALRISPHFAETLLNVAAVDYGLGRFAESLEVLDDVPSAQRDEAYYQRRQVVMAAIAASGVPSR